jgi:HK97 family phage portal protein
MPTFADPLLRGLDLLERKAAGNAYRPNVARPFIAGQPVYSDWSTDRAVKKGFKASTWVYRCCTMTMEGGSQVPFGIQRKNSKGQWDFDWRDPRSKLLGRWNRTFDAHESMQRCIGHLLLGGNALIGKYRGLGQVRQLRVEDPTGVTPIPDNAGDFERYDYFDSLGQARSWEARDVIHARLPDPCNPYWGVGRLTALARAVDTDLEMVALNKRRLESGGVPDGILVDPSIVSQSQRIAAQKELEKSWRDVRGPFLQGEGIDWIQLGLPQRELQWLEGRLFTMREIVIGFGYHPALFGEDATYANSESAQKQKWSDAILPVLSIIARALTLGLVEDDSDAEDTRVWYDTSGVAALREAIDGKVKNYVALVGAAVPPDSAKDMLELPLPDLPDGMGKIAMVSGTLTTLEKAQAEDPPPEQLVPGGGLLGGDPNAEGEGDTGDPPPPPGKPKVKKPAKVAA